MCVAVYKPAGTVVTRRMLRNCFISNPDGAGFMFAHKGELNIVKGFFGFRSFYKTFRLEERTHPKSNFVLHFRIATHGDVDINNCHPISVNNDLAFVHNGIFIDFSHTGQNLSDTQLFNTNILQRFPPYLLQKKEIVDAIDDYCKAGFCKLVFLDSKGRATIFNESGGLWKDDVWFSNYSYADVYVHKSKWYYDLDAEDSLNEIKSEFDNDGDDSLEQCGLCGNHFPLSKLVEAKEDKLGLICEECSEWRAAQLGDNVKIVCPFCGYKGCLWKGFCASCSSFIPTDERIEVSTQDLIYD